ncbi:hypothetical protein FCG67_03635 [Rhodococcus oryzae]|uniref:Uncharacterized protein n=1 Tax=Rhodococcus oryzae TaxID=2571143 RepID=A0ABY2RNF1_9NOCA|nr:hypothetical protein FCG67_03635 [Rhodococcus oryzae]
MAQAPGTTFAPATPPMVPPTSPPTVAAGTPAASAPVTAPAAAPPTVAAAMRSLRSASTPMDFQNVLTCASITAEVLFVRLRYSSESQFG